MRTSSAVVKIDGSYGEGGGSIVRTALVMSALTQQPVELESIRAGTDYPGLDIEDIVIAKAIGESCDAQMAGFDLGSETVAFHPNSRSRNINGPLEETSGLRKPNALIALSTLLPVLARSGAYSSTVCIGETYGANSLTFDYFSNVILFAMRKMGLYAFADQTRAGFGRESLGSVAMDVEPSVLTGLKWSSRGKLLDCQAKIAFSQLPPMIPNRGLEHLRHLSQTSGVPIKTSSEEVKADRPGVFLTLWAQYERGAAGSVAMGQRGVRVESLAQRAFDELSSWITTEATVDPFVAEQLLVPGIFAEGETTFRTSKITDRFLTSVWVAKQFAPIRVTVRGKENGPGDVSIRGIDGP